jgi:hypothetical protein
MRLLRIRPQFNGLSITLSLPILALTSLLSSTPSLATTQFPQSPTPSESNPALMANIFRSIGDAVSGVGEVIETVNTVDSILQQMTGGDQAPQPQAAPNASPSPATPPASRPSTTAQTSSNARVIHRNDRPTRCQLQSGGQTTQCEAFQITQGDSVLIFSYYFNGVPISLLALAEPVQQTDSVSGYVVGGLMIGTERSEMLGSCVVARLGNQQYQQTLCTTESGLEFRYIN